MISLLGNGAIVNDEKWFNDMLEDLNIRQIFQGIKSVSSGYNVEDMYKMFPVNREMMEFRREITKDIGNESIRKLFDEFSRGMKRVRSLEDNGKYSKNEVQQIKFHCSALNTYFETLNQLRMGLEQVDRLCFALQSVLESVQAYMDKDSIRESKTLAKEVYTYFCENGFLVSVGKDIVKIEKCSLTRDKDETLTNHSLGGIKVDNLGDVLQLLPIEKVLVQYFEQNEKKLFKTMTQLRKVKIEEDFLTLENELQFYLNFYRYIVQFQQMGYDFCMPELGDSIEIEDGYDFALAGKKMSNSNKVVANSFRLCGQERIVVVTGANGGGKTTYARMVGEILFFSMLGLLAPAKSVTLPYFDSIRTHFSVEESEKIGRGKLLEELQRLKLLFEGEKEKQFVILNELFTTAATKDALEMGKHTMDLMIKMDMWGIYVTHIQGLAEETEHIVSMVAELAKDHKTRLYRILRRLPEEEEYEDSLIEKHHLLEEQIKEVLSNGLQ